MQIPILSGIYSDDVPDFRTSYPRNMIPVPKVQGISSAYIRPADGIISQGTGAGIGRGGINWNGECYRVMGQELVKIDQSGGEYVIGTIAGSDNVSFDYSFDKLAICAHGGLYYYDGAALVQVTDADLGTAIDVVWVDSYFMTTDGEFLVVTELANPTSVDPLKYGSAEADPDRIKSLLKVRNEVHAVNRYTTEVYENIGGATFPFQRIEGAQLQRGTVGTHAVANFANAIAFVGSGRNESPAVWLGSNGQTIKLSTREIDQILADYSESELSESVVESRVTKGHETLYIHLPTQTLCYDAAASQVVGDPVWYTLTSSVVGNAQYRARHFVWCYDRWLCEDPQSSSYGYFTDSVCTHWGNVIGWEFGTSIFYNEGKSAIIHELELVCLTGRVALGVDPVVWTSYSNDGVTWSQEKYRTVGKIGDRNVRVSWLQQGVIGHWRMQKFRGTSDANIAIARLEASVEPLYV